MSCYSLRKKLTLAMGLSLAFSGAHAESLSLQDAIQRAYANDVNVARLAADAAALEQLAVANSQLPDPKLKLGAMNFPTDSFNRSQEPMTQLQVGVVQAFPPGDTLRLKGERTQAMAHAKDESGKAQQLKLERDTRLAFLDLYFHQQSLQIVDKTRDTFEEQLNVIRSHYASGRLHQQDVLRASVELALLEDKQSQIQTSIDKANAAMTELIGPFAASSLASPFNDIQKPPSLTELEAGLLRHPEMRMENAMLSAEQLAVDVARQAYKPGWTLDVTYGDRDGNNPNGSERSDFLSAMVMMNIPLFKDKRQDRTLAARQQTVTATKLKREARLLALTKQLYSHHADWMQNEQRLNNFRNRILPQANESAEAALSAYQNRVSNFNTLIRARLTEFDSELKALRTQINHAKAQIQLLYLAGDNHE